MNVYKSGLTAALSILLISCGAGTAKEENHDVVAVEVNGQALSTAATTDIIGDILSNIAGGKADVRVIIPAGRSPHSYEPTPRDVAALDNADIIFVNGLNLEESLLPILEDLDEPVIVPVSAGIEVLFLGEDDDHTDDDEHDHSAGDPHFWFSPLNAIVWSRNISRTLQTADPANAEFYAARTDEYTSQLEGLDVEIRDMVNRIPQENRKLLMDHAALSYFARDYGFEILGHIVESVSDQAEPSARQVADLTELMTHEGVDAVFVGESAGRGISRLAESVAAESGRDVRVVRLLTGSLAAEGERGSTYIDYIRLNTERIAEALGGSRQ
ncbi:MAG: metal ABC transporter substrate-binding protein [Spirochaetaceae bacterium]|nr:metal ABC transporter substrate-binding protein [Spirochaetaceae bacterium]MDT8299001.1 metal ABC transporter substrate-binding protein [Spirochaetaceae bacterium]